MPQSNCNTYQHRDGRVMYVQVAPYSPWKIFAQKSMKCKISKLFSRGFDRGYINVVAIFTSDSRFDRTNGPCTKQVLICCRKMSGEPILIQATDVCSYQ